MAFRALTKQQLAHAQEMKGMSRENALGEFIRHQLHPLGERGELSRHMRIFNWEAVRPTAVYRKLMSEEAAPFMALAVDLVRRFLPKADQSTLIMAAVWLVGQCSILYETASSWLTRQFRWLWTGLLSSGLQGSSAPGRSPAWRPRHKGQVHSDRMSEALRKKAPSEGGDSHAWGYEAGETTIYE